MFISEAQTYYCNASTFFNARHDKMVGWCTGCISATTGKA